MKNGTTEGTEMQREIYDLRICKINRGPEGQGGKEEFSNFPSSPLGAVIFNLLGFGLTGLSVFIFERRKSYIE